LAVAAIVLAIVSLVNDFRLRQRLADDAVPVFGTNFGGMTDSFDGPNTVAFEPDPAFLIDERADVPDDFDAPPEIRRDIRRRLDRRNEASLRTVVYGEPPTSPREPLRASVLFR
jgi:hypothetical protein